MGKVWFLRLGKGQSPPEAERESLKTKCAQILQRETANWTSYKKSQ